VSKLKHVGYEIASPYPVQKIYKEEHRTSSNKNAILSPKSLLSC